MEWWASVLCENYSVTQGPKILIESVSVFTTKSPAAKPLTGLNFRTA